MAKVVMRVAYKTGDGSKVLLKLLDDGTLLRKDVLSSEAKRYIYLEEEGFTPWLEGITPEMLEKMVEPYNAVIIRK